MACFCSSHWFREIPNFPQLRDYRSCLNYRSYLDLRSYLEFRNHLDFRSYLDLETLYSSRSCLHRCGKAATLQCPKCVEQGLPKAGSAFCSQDCFKVRPAYAVLPPHQQRQAAERSHDPQQQLRSRT